MYPNIQRIGFANRFQDPIALLCNPNCMILPFFHQVKNIHFVWNEDVRTRLLFFRLLPDPIGLFYCLGSRLTIKPDCHLWKLRQILHFWCVHLAEIWVYDSQGPKQLLAYLRHR